MKKLIYISTLIILLSCSESSKTSFYPKSYFNSELKTIKVNLQNILGDSFSIIGKRDTITYKVAYDKKLKTNTIQSLDFDTIFYGTVNRKSGLYILNKKIEDSIYWYSAINIEDSLITGFSTINFQMFMIDNLIDSSDLLINQLQQDTNIYELTPNKKIVKNIFWNIIDSLKPEKLITYKSSDLITENDIKQDSVFNLNIYPNPFINDLNIELNKLSKYKYVIMNSQSKIIKEGEFNKEKEKLDLSFLIDGEYYIKITDLNSNEIIIKKIIKNF